MTATVNGQPPITSPVGGLPVSWEERAAELARRMTVLADAKMRATVVHAEAYLDADGPATLRDQVARLAAASAQQDAAYAQAELECYRLLLDAARDGRPE